MDLIVFLRHFKIKDNFINLHKRLPIELLVSIEDFKKILKLKELLQEFKYKN